MLLRAELERMEEVARARRRAAGDRPERSRSGEGLNPALNEIFLIKKELRPHGGKCSTIQH